MNYSTAIIALDREKSARLDRSYIMIFVIFIHTKPNFVVCMYLI